MNTCVYTINNNKITSFSSIHVKGSVLKALKPFLLANVNLLHRIFRVRKEKKLKKK